MQIWAGLLGAVALMAALIYWLRFCTLDDPGLAGAVVKTLSTGALAVFLWIAAGTVQGLWAVSLGISLGTAGDWFLARRGQAAFLAGMAAFGAGHLAYAGALLARSSGLGFDGVSAGEWAVFGLLAALVLSTEVWLAPRTGALRWPVRAYVVLIGLMGVAAVLVPAGPGQAGLRLGAVLFLASDLLLALRMFVVTAAARQRLLSRALWPAYWAGQALISWGAVLFWTFPKG